MLQGKGSKKEQRKKSILIVAGVVCTVYGGHNDKEDLVPH